MTRPGSVLQVTSSARRRGAEMFAAQLGEQLRVRGWRVHELALEDAGDLPFDRMTHGRFDPRSLSGLTRRCGEHDVVISHGGSTLAPVATAAGLASRPFVYRNIGDPAYWGRVRLAGTRLGVPLRRAAHIVGLYRGAAAYLTHRYRLRPDRLTVISNAVDAERFPRRDEQQRTRARAQLGLDTTRVVGYLGSLSSEKRPEWAVDVAASSAATLLVGGDGPLRADLERRCAARGVDGRFLGVVTDVGEFLGALDILVIPSRTEGVPGVLLESALAGVPVVATDVGGVGEVMARLGAGEIVPADDEVRFRSAVATVLAAPQSYVADRRAVIDDHDLSRVADRWHQVLTSVVAG